MKRKSLVAMLVVFAMSVSLLAGCGSKTEKPAETTKKTEESKDRMKNGKQKFSQTLKQVQNRTFYSSSQTQMLSRLSKPAKL